MEADRVCQRAQGNSSNEGDAASARADEDCALLVGQLSGVRVGTWATGRSVALAERNQVPKGIEHEELRALFAVTDDRLR